MSSTKEQILDMVRALPEQERWEFLEELESAYEPPVPAGLTREEFSAELERRWQAHLADPSQSRPADEVMAELWRKHLDHE